MADAGRTPGARAPRAKRSETWEPVGTRVNFVSTSAGWDQPRTSLFTDHYELTMLQAPSIPAPRTAGQCSRPSRAGCRTAGATGSWAAPAGCWRASRTSASARLSWNSWAAPAWSTRRPWTTWPTSASPATSGATPEGEAYFPNSPILIVESTFAEACILETYILSVLNHDSAIASAASRMITAAGDRPCIEMGSRRTHEESATAAPAPP